MPLPALHAGEHVDLLQEQLEIPVGKGRSLTPDNFQLLTVDETSPSPCRNLGCIILIHVDDLGPHSRECLNDVHVTG